MKHFIELLLKRATNLIPRQVALTPNILVTQYKESRETQWKILWKQKSLAHPAAFNLHTCLFISPTFSKAAYIQAFLDTNILCHFNNAKHSK